MSSLDIILPRSFLKNASISTTIHIHENTPNVNEILLIAGGEIFFGKILKK